VIKDTVSFFISPQKIWKMCPLISPASMKQDKYAQIMYITRQKWKKKHYTKSNKRPVPVKMQNPARKCPPSMDEKMSKV